MLSFPRSRESILGVACYRCQRGSPPSRGLQILSTLFFVVYKEFRKRPIGETTANHLRVLLPELGSLNRKQIASLTGLAPIANDSGLYQGYRATGHGRAGMKPTLFMAAMAVRNSNAWLKSFYNQLVEAGKKKIVALAALMRKIIVIANARVRDFESATLSNI